MTLNWRSGYLRQAESDHTMLLKLLADETDGKVIPLCHQLHYLQMTTEKLAKGFLSPTDGSRPIRSHNGFVRFIQHANRVPEIRRACNFKRKQDFAAYLNSLAPLAGIIEDLSPEGPDHANPEYPWEIKGSIFSPLDFPFHNFNFKSLKMINSPYAGGHFVEIEPAALERLPRARANLMKSAAA